jgi:hypothetical protein
MRDILPHKNGGFQGLVAWRFKIRHFNLDGKIKFNGKFFCL